MYLGIFSVNDAIYFRANTVDKQGSSIDATAGPTFTAYANNGTTSLANGTMTKVGAKTGNYQGTFTAATATFSAGQHFILIEATVDSETPSATINFQLTSDTQSVEESFSEIQTISSNVPSLGIGSQSIDHNFGSTDALRVLSGGTPIADVAIRAFVKTDYDAGKTDNKFAVAQTITKTDGRWSSLIRLDPGTYTLEFVKQGIFRTFTTNITVT